MPPARDGAHERTTGPRAGGARERGRDGRVRNKPGGGGHRPAAGRDSASCVARPANRRWTRDLTPWGGAHFSLSRTERDEGGSDGGRHHPRHMSRSPGEWLEGTAIGGRRPSSTVWKTLFSSMMSLGGGGSSRLVRSGSTAGVVSDPRPTPARVCRLGRLSAPECAHAKQCRGNCQSSTAQLRHAIHLSSSTVCSFPGGSRFRPGMARDRIKCATPTG